MKKNGFINNYNYKLNCARLGDTQIVDCLHTTTKTTTTNSIESTILNILSSCLGNLCIIVLITLLGCKNVIFLCQFSNKKQTLIGADKKG